MKINLDGEKGRGPTKDNVQPAYQDDICTRLVNAPGSFEGPTIGLLEHAVHFNWGFPDRSVQLHQHISSVPHLSLATGGAPSEGSILILVKMHRMLILTNCNAHATP